MAATTTSGDAAAAAPVLVNGADEENWVEVRSGLQTASEAATNSSPTPAGAGNSWQQVATSTGGSAAAGNFEQSSNAANWTYIDASGFESVAVFNGLLLAPSSGVPTPPPPPPLSHGGGVFRPRGSRGRGGGGGRGHYQRGISSNNVAR